jgi:hypothetical protein
MRIELSGAALRTKRLESPLVGGLIAPENIRIAVIGQDSEVDGVGAIPLIFDGIDEQYGIPEPEFDGPLISLMTGVTFDPEFHTTW